MLKIEQFKIGQLMTNTYVVWDENTRSAVVIDPAGQSQQLMKFIDDNLLEVKAIVLTHAHGDHIGGITWLQEKIPGLSISLGRDDVDLLTDPRKNFSEYIFGKNEEYKDINVLLDGDMIEIGDEKLKVINTPGHTEGGISLYSEGMLFSGDTLFLASVGRTDLPGGDYNKIVTSIKNKLFALPDETVVYPGHDDTTTIAYEKAHNPYVR